MSHWKIIDKLANNFKLFNVISLSRFLLQKNIVLSWGVLARLKVSIFDLHLVEDMESFLNFLMRHINFRFFKDFFMLELLDEIIDFHDILLWASPWGNQFLNAEFRLPDQTLLEALSAFMLCWRDFETNKILIKNESLLF